MDIFKDEYNKIYKPNFMDHQLNPYISSMKILGYPYTGFNIDYERNKHSFLFSYLESNEILYFELNDELLSKINTRKMEVPKYNYNKKLFR